LTSGRSTFDEADRGFEIFKNKQDNCEKVVLKP
jgi:threonine dehydrogenase-like Zn-dependent dehydrogenase